MAEQRHPARGTDRDGEGAKMRAAALERLADALRRHLDQDLAGEIPSFLAPLIERLDGPDATDGLVVIVTRNPEEWQDAVTVLREYRLHAILREDNKAALALLASSARRVKLFLTDIHPAGDDDGIELACTVGKRWPWVRAVVASAFPDKWLGVPDDVVFLKKPILPLDVVKHADACRRVP